MAFVLRAHVVVSLSLVAGCATQPPVAPDWRQLTASQAAQLVCAGRLSSVDLVQASLAQARAHPELNAFVTLDEAGALRAARDADASRGSNCKPLHGVPIVLKDNIHVAGLPSTGGTPALRGFVPPADAPVVKALRDAGAIVLGKTQMHELAFGISGYNPAFTPASHVGVRNAWDASRMAGGSSSGNGAAVGAHIVPLALGTDTGGSVRIPCALNGCVALRPTVGRYSLEGILPISHTRDTAGPMAVSMADIELVDRVITGATPVGAADLRGVRLGIAREAFLGNLDPDTRAGFDATMARLRAAGVTLVDVAMPTLGALNDATSFPVALYEAFDDVTAYLARHVPALTLPQLAALIASPDVKGTYQGLVIPRKLPGPNNTLVDAAPAYDAAMRTHRPSLQKLYADTFASQRLDALVFPTVPKVAIPATPDASSLENFLLFIRNTDPGSNAGIPGLQIPMGLGATSRLPLGLELDGPAGSDRRLIAIGLALEHLLGRLPAPGNP